MTNRKGFTLLEVIIALSIIAGVIIVLSASWSGNFMRIRKASLNNNVAFLLERKLTELEIEFKDKPIEEIPASDGGDFGSDFKQYSWQMKSQDFEMPDLSEALIGRDGGANESLLAIIKQTTEYISKSVKEVTVTVNIKTKTRVVKYSITTYFVDYNRAGPLGGGQ